jgi:D-alanyl-lipoteichoic acid acyltransferase DltB (MBOAT superfamily)
VPSEFAALVRYLPLLVTFLAYVPAAWILLRLGRGAAWRAGLLAALNACFLPALCLAGSGLVRGRYLRDFVLESAAWIAGYLCLTGLSYLALRWWGRERGPRFWLSFAFPIAAMVVVRYAIGGSVRLAGGMPAAALFLGISYWAFRLSYLAIEYRNRVIEHLTPAEYLAFAFFPPILSIGPISQASLFLQSLRTPDAGVTPAPRSALRFLVGLTKYQVLSSLVNQIAYQGLLLDGHPHHWIDLPIAAVSYYVYLYLNFSGWCDMAIGAAGLLGIRVAENFDRPFTSRNVQEYWSRWHITLSGYMRDTVFSPLSKALVQRMGPKRAPHAIAITIMVVFLLMGLWHGVAWHYVVYDLLQGAGVATVHYYTLWLKRRLGRDGYARYMADGRIRAAATALTFSFQTASLFFFANPASDWAKLWAVFR